MSPLEAIVAFKKKISAAHKFHIDKLQKIRAGLSNDARSTNGANLLYVG